MWFPSKFRLWRSARRCSTLHTRRSTKAQLTLEALEARTVPAFLAPVSYSGGGSAVHVGDFNNDGHLDLLAAVNSQNKVQVRLGNGDGTFGPTISSAAVKNVQSTDIADFNNDGKLDVLMLANGAGYNTANVCLGNGDGTFQKPKITKIESGVLKGSKLLDYNSDGILDLRVTTQNVGGPGGITYRNHTYRGNGDGTFQYATSQVSFGTSPPVVLGDFNADGIQDRVDVTATGVDVRLGNGDGTYQPPLTFPAGASPLKVAVGDFNGDGYADLVVSNYDSSSYSLAVLLNDGHW